MADIFIGAADRGRVYQLPFVPDMFPEITCAANNEEFETYQDGSYSLLGAPGLREVTLEGVLPNRDYRFAKSSVHAKAVISLLENAMKRKKPLRLVLSGKSRLNLLVGVEALRYHEDRCGDLAYSVQFKEYRYV